MIAFGILQFICLRSAGQMTMPDHACTGQTKQYYVYPGKFTGSTFTWWIDGTVMPEFNTNEFAHTWNSSGIHMLEVQELSSDGCPGPKLSGQIIVNPLPEIQISVTDTLLCDGESVTMSVENQDVLLWGTLAYDLIVEAEAGVTGTTTNSTYSGQVILNEILFNNDVKTRKVVYRFIPVIVNDERVRCCEGEEVQVTIRINPGFRCRERSLVIPNAFSPNGDGINDVWNITGKDFYPGMEVTIYNRWGQVVWKSGRGYPAPWDGRSRGKSLPVDSYHYCIRIHDGTRAMTGTVTVVK